MSDSRIIDLPDRLDDSHMTLVKLDTDDAPNAAKEATTEVQPNFRQSDVLLLPLTLEPVNIICPGLDYRDHIEELGRSSDFYPRGFFETLQSVVGHLRPLAIPTLSKKYDSESESYIPTNCSST
jgi:2-keto-4-pentenoate hydratase/2-oxohepta-3-ene-1,7-dioic acid hydratase in catechol pathway